MDCVVFICLAYVFDMKDARDDSGSMKESKACAFVFLP